MYKGPELLERAAVTSVAFYIYEDQRKNSNRGLSTLKTYSLAAVRCCAPKVILHSENVCVNLVYRRSLCVVMSFGFKQPNSLMDSLSIEHIDSIVTAVKRSVREYI